MVSKHKAMLRPILDLSEAKRVRFGYAQHELHDGRKPQSFAKAARLCATSTALVRGRCSVERIELRESRRQLSGDQVVAKRRRDAALRKIRRARAAVRLRSGTNCVPKKKRAAVASDERRVTSRRRSGASCDGCDGERVIRGDISARITLWQSGVVPPHSEKYEGARGGAVAFRNKLRSEKKASCGGE